MPSLTYCEFQVQECERKASETTDKRMRAYWLNVRDSWIKAINNNNEISVNIQPPDIIRDLRRIV
jgi:hypothetical protein